MHAKEAPLSAFIIGYNDVHAL